MLGARSRGISANQVLIGAGLIVVLAVGSQVLASRLAIPALIVLLPVGFLAGALTPDVDPVRLLGPVFQPLVTLAVSVILYDAGLGLNLGKLYLALRILRLPEVLGTNVQLATVIAVAAGCDVLRQESGLIAAIVMGLAVSNLTWFDIPARRPFFETLVQLIIGLLFISIGATITPDSLQGVLLPTAGLVAVLVFIARPFAALISTLGSGMRGAERNFIAWMDPRGIVAAATASAFAIPLIFKGVDGADKILPVTFLVIVSTVALYGLTAKPVARLLKVLEAARARPLLVGGNPWVIDLGRSLRIAGLDVLMWAGHERQRRQITQAQLNLAPGELLASATGEGAELEGITAVYLLTEEDDFNALAATILRGEAGGEDAAGPSVYALAPPSADHGVVAPFTDGDRLFGSGISRASLDRRYERGARIDAVPSDGTVPGGYDMLFVVDHAGRLEPATEKATPRPRPGDTLVLLARDES